MSVSAAIESLLSYSATDWAVSGDDEIAILALLKNDTNFDATIRDLDKKRLLWTMIDRVDEKGNRRSLVQILGGRVGAGSATRVRANLAPVPGLYFDFDVSHNLQSSLRAFGLGMSVATFNINPLLKLIPRKPGAPFTGVGATGVTGRKISIPLLDQYRMWRKDPATLAKYDNPIPGNLFAYLATLTPTQRKGQVKLLLRRPIVSQFPDSYANGLPSRAQITRAAAKKHKLEPALVSAFMLAEQRDQSQIEGAKDIQGAESRLQKNFSIGLGQVVVSTARKENLFQDLLPTSVYVGLAHNRIVLLLSSDEFNIFAVARYIRYVADMGATHTPGTLPKTHVAFPGLAMPDYKKDSKHWSDANIRAIGCEYTSTPWDDKKLHGWGDFVLEAYRDVVTAGIF